MTTFPHNEYQTVRGTEPDVDEQHMPRTLTHIRATSEDDATLSMMSEIGDGTFVQWSSCSRCNTNVSDCRCAGGPQEPEHIRRWRESRFVESFGARGAEPALPVLVKQRDRRVNGVIRHLLRLGWTVEPPTPEAPEYDPSLEEVEDDAAPYSEADDSDTRSESDTAVHVARGLDDAIEAASASKEQGA